MAKAKKVEEVAQEPEIKKEETAVAVMEQPKPSPIAAVIQAEKPYEFEAQRQADRRKVKGIFRDLEVKGGVIKFAFKKWKGDDIVPYELHDGQEYELPLGVVKHLNNLCHYEDSFSKDLLSATGHPMKNPNPKKVSRFSFQATEYMQD